MRRRRALGARLAQLRIERGLTQAELSMMSGVSRGTIIDVEFGRRGLLYERLGDIAQVLGVTASDMLEGIK